MAINVISAGDNKDIDGLLGKEILANNVMKSIFKARKNSKYTNLNLNIVNIDSTDVNVRLWITTNKLPSDIDIIESNIVLKPDAVYFRSNIILGPSEILYAISGNGHCVIRAEGYENTNY
jgi:hypothetical protein